MKNIVVRGAREHNLKNIDVDIPRDKLTVITGVSGSGKSSLAFDTIYAEGQRRYVESLSAYARQFLGLMEKPDVDHIEGLSPAISIDQKGVSKNPRSTVGTVTEIYDYLRLMFSRAGRPHCPKCGRPVQRQTVQQIVDAILQFEEGTRVMIMGTIVTHMKGEHAGIFATARKDGFSRVRVDGAIRMLEEEISLEKNRWHDIQIVVDRIVIRPDADKGRLTDSVETALKLGKGSMLVFLTGAGRDKKGKSEEIPFSEHFACTQCGISINELEPRNFSFNTPYGACPACTGLGYKMEVDPTLIVEDDSLSFNEGAIIPWSNAGVWSSFYESTMNSLSDTFGFSLDVPVKSLSKEILKLVLYGSDGRDFKMSHITKSGNKYTWMRKFEGVIPNLKRRYTETESEGVKTDIERYMTQRVCVSCKGDRLKPEALAVTILGLNIIEVTRQSVAKVLEWTLTCRTGKHQDGAIAAESMTERESMISSQILKEVEARLGFLQRVGLDYLTLDRTAATLSGGEGQRIRLATQIGSGLMGVLYVCDEPSIGLHPADNARLIRTLESLRDVGNTVIIVEHDEAVMRAADHIVDLGPGAGVNGGKVIAQGKMEDIIAEEASLTGAYLSGRKKIETPKQRRNVNKGSILIKKAAQNNLKRIDVEFPLGRLVCVTGVSGSGKSTLVNDILSKALMRHFYKSKTRPGQHQGISGAGNLDKVINIDQSPIGRTPRSNPATYTGLFTPIRELFASMPEAKARGYKPGRFSFNVKGGRCEACSGAGLVQIEMQFLPDVTVPCDTCRGARYNREALEILFKGISISTVLNTTVTEALNVFQNIPSIKNKLTTLSDVGLGYLKLGQPATTLSGGEAQRIKLSAELSRRATGKTLYILDEPTSGLSFDDCAKLVDVLHRLTDAGNTVVLIEHHLDFIKNADWIIDMGPGAGDKGGKIVVEGEPEFIASIDHSLTGQYLAKYSHVVPGGLMAGMENSELRNGHAALKRKRRSKSSSKIPAQQT